MDTQVLNEVYSVEKSYIDKYKREINKKNKSDKIIILRLDLIGDCILFSPAAKAICEYYHDRDKTVTIVCLSISKPIFERLGTFDRIIELDFKPTSIDYEKLDDVISELREDEYDLLLQPQISKCPVADILAVSIKCNKRIAIRTRYGNSPKEWIKYTDFIYDRIIGYPQNLWSEFDGYGVFIRNTINPEYRTEAPRLEYHNPKYVKGDYYVLYPGGSIKQKFWPAEKYAYLAEYIYHKTGFTGVILGVESEKWIAEDIEFALPRYMKNNILNLMGKTTIDDVIDIIGNAKFVVSNDTSGVHIACATQTPSVVIVGGWHYDRFFPYHIEDIKKDDVIPLVANTRMACYYCDWVWDNIEKVNPDCLENLKAERLSICVAKVRYEQVRKLVDKIIREGNMSNEDQ